MAPRRFSKAWNEEFAVLKEMQDDRMTMHSNFTCHERCVSHYMTNTLILNEHACMERCLSKYAQAGIITNLVFGKFEEHGGKAATPSRRK
mmetsp:Transcript_45608/g.52695  ORF Transcript_45608/g.52695 Transcript_45608/m.52695 type:complete len:90 (+) Transcript_45608:32-301(+)